MSIRLAALCLLLAAIAASDWYAYNRGKASVIRGIIAGTATFQKEQAVVAKADIAQASTDAATITQLESERDRLRKLVAAKATTVAQPACTLPNSVLDELRKSAQATATK